MISIATRKPAALGRLRIFYKQLARPGSNALHQTPYVLPHKNSLTVASSLYCAFVRWRPRCNASGVLWAAITYRNQIAFASTQF